MFLDRKNQYCENGYTIDCNLQIQCDPYQITNGIFIKTLTKFFSQFIWKHKRPLIVKVVFRKKNGAGGTNFLTSDHTTKLQSPKRCGTDTKAEI